MRTEDTRPYGSGGLGSAIPRGTFRRHRSTSDKASAAAVSGWDLEVSARLALTSVGAAAPHQWVRSAKSEEEVPGHVWAR